MKRLVVISDTHYGHQYGLTPPRWKVIKSIQPIDILVANGDLIDGKGTKPVDNKRCTCDLRLLMIRGCTCGALDKNNG